MARRRVRVDCNTSLHELLGSVCSGGCVEALAILIASSDIGPIGRKLIARLLGIGEKKARLIIDKLRRAGLVAVTRSGAEAEVEGLYCITRQDRTLALLSCNREAALRKLSRLLELRDRIVILLGDPALLEVIGYIDSRRVEIPHVEDNIARTYHEMLLPLRNLDWCRDGCLAAVFNSPDCYRCCASLLQASTALG